MAKVLVVDDVRAQVELICQALRSGGLVTASAYSGQEALAMLAEVSPDLVLLDVLMPDMSGYEVLRKIRKNKATRQMPVVMLTTKSAEHDRVWGLEMGADAYLTKPFETEHLVSVIQRLLWETQGTT